MFPFRWLMVIFVFSIGAIMMVNGDVFKGELDLILVVDSSASINSISIKADNFNKIKESLKKLPDQFPVGPNQTRMAIIHFGNHSVLELGLTDDAEKYKATISNMRYMSAMTYTGEAMKMTVSEIRKSQITRPNAPKAVILVTDGYPNDGPLAKQQAEIIRKQIGELLFIAFIEHVRDDEVTKRMEEMTIKENLHKLDNFTELTAALFSKISQQLVQQIKCLYTKVCQYKDQSRQQCVGEWVQQSLDDTVPECSKYTKPATNVSCDMANCTALCDLWKWEDVRCKNTTCGQNLTIKRERDRPGWNPKFDNCLQQEPIPISCPPCPAAKQTDEKSGFPLWVIGLIIGILLLILLAIAIAVVMRRRRSRQAALKAKMATAAAAQKAAEMAAAARNSPKSAGGKSMQIPKTPKGSMMGASGYGMQFGGFGGKMSVDQSVAANLETGQTTLKPSGNFGRSRINKPSSSINVNNMKKLPKSMIKK